MPEISTRSLAAAIGVSGVIVLALSLGPTPIIVQGSSMEPAIDSGQVVYCSQDVDQIEDVEVGDIVAFEWRGDIYVHRVAGQFYDKAIFAEGDANANQTEFVPIEDVRCTVDRTQFRIPLEVVP